MIEHQALERAREGFSALQRAENSSMQIGIVIVGLGFRFSALQRAENSSIIIDIHPARAVDRVSVLFSEPKIPQSRPKSSQRNAPVVSVLFSEPKIPQS